MTAREILEMVVGKNKDFEKDIKKRKSILRKKIDKINSAKKNFFSSLEDIAEASILTKTATNKTKEIVEFVVKKLNEYKQQKKDFNIPLASIKNDMVRSLIGAKVTLTKNDIKLIKKYMEVTGEKDFQKTVRILLTTPKKFSTTILKNAEKLKSGEPSIDMKDWEDFIKNVSANKTFKKLLREMNSAIQRLLRILYETEYTTEQRNKKPIKL